MSWVLFWQILVFEIVAAITVMTFAGNAKEKGKAKDGD
jgi:hypothetical protein